MSFTVAFDFTASCDPRGSLLDRCFLRFGLLSNGQFLGISDIRFGFVLLLKSNQMMKEKQPTWRTMCLVLSAIVEQVMINEGFKKSLGNGD